MRKQVLMQLVCTSTLLIGTAFAQAADSGGGSEHLRVADCQILNGPDLDRNTAKILQWIEVAVKRQVDVVSFPEACLPGYLPDGAYYERLGPDSVAAAEARIAEASKCLDIAVVLGSVHWSNRELYNSLLAIDKGEIVRGRYAKTYLAENWSTPGKSLPVLTLAGAKSCFIICHDVRRPELVRLPSIIGAQIFYFCSHESSLTKEQKLSAYRAMPISRATENTIFLVMANAAASPTDLGGSHGNSKSSVLTATSWWKRRISRSD